MGGGKVPESRLENVCLVMNRLSLTDLGHLVGLSSLLPLFVGLGCSAYGIAHRDRAIPRGLSLAMGVVALFLWFFALPSTYAYSGPLTPAERELPRYSIYLGILVSLTFGFAFALDGLRMRELSRRILAVALALLYAFAAWKLITYCYDPM